MDTATRPPYVRYEYKELTVPRESASMLLDCYESFGWVQDENFIVSPSHDRVTLHLKRDRKLVNKAELTRLQRKFEACTEEIAALERAKTAAATAWALAIGIIGTAFMAGSVFVVTSTPPLIFLCILLAIPAFAGWIAPIFVFRTMCEKKTRAVQPLIEAKHDEIYDICEKGHSLL